MAVHESSVNYENLIRDLADMYPFEVAEVVLVELVANSLDARPDCIRIDFDPTNKVLTVTDNGKGMTASDFEQYHDFAAGLKTRGTGIGFAGVGAKISFNIANRVITETRSQSFFGGSNWYLQSKRKLLWEDIEPTHLSGQGTRVEVRFNPATKLSYTSTGDVLKLLRRHYLPLFDRKFLKLYDHLDCYPENFRFVVNGQVIEPTELTADLALDKIKEFFPQKAGKRIGYGFIGLAQSEYLLGGDLCGILLCTRGKVIKADLFNQFPGTLGTRILGIVEVPGFVNFLTTAKTDFIRGREKHREFESLYGPIREEFKTWLRELGVQPAEIIGADEAIRLERELKKLLDDVPELSVFFGFRTRKTVPQLSTNGTMNVSFQEGTDFTFPVGAGEAGVGEGPVDIGDQPGLAPVEDEEGGTETAKPISRVGRRGPKIAFADAPDRIDLAWVDGNNVIINSGHASYVKVRSDTIARRIHNLFAIASAVQRFLTGGGEGSDLMFVDRMMTAWGKK